MIARADAFPEYDQLLALLDAGYVAEAKRWRDWLVRAVAGTPAKAQIMYGLAGERRLAEWEADWLPGYEGSRPVRIGNGAANQRQLDVYGEVADALPGVYGSRLCGAGFGGCTIHLVDAAAAGEAARALADGFEHRYGRRPPVHAVRAAEGASPLAPPLEGWGV